MNAKSQFATRLVALRKEKGVSQYDLAAALSLSRSTYSGYETEGKQPDYECLVRLASYLDTSTDYLLGCSDIPHPNADVFTIDCQNYKKHRDALPAHVRKMADGIFDDFYIMISKEMRSGNAKKLAIYGELFGKLRAASAEISLRLGSGDPFDVETMADVMAAQNSAKSALSAAVDKLMQAELTSAVAHKNPYAKPKDIAT